MKSWNGRTPALGEESHFGRPPVRCFRERPRSLLQMLGEAIARNPGGEALVCGGTRLTWTGLGERIAAAAGAFAARGVGPGDRVGILLGNRPEFVIAFLGATWLGAIAVPISIREQKPGLEYILGHCDAKVVVHEPDLADRLPEGITTLLPNELPVSTFSRIEPVKTAEEDTAAIMYTSGTTGRPKGAMLTNLGIVHSSMVFEACLRLDRNTRALSAVPLSHVTGVIALMTSVVRCAGTLLVLPAFKAADFLDLAERERMTYTLMVPAMYRLCLLEPGFAKRDLSAWTIGGYGGAPMPAATISELAQVLPRLALMNAYGATETTSPATIMPAEDQAARLDSVGLPVPGAEIKVVDGELWIRGPMVVKGYWENPEATEREFTDGFWRSGDLGAMDAEGFVRVLDRKKDMINRGGHKVFTAEVESALAEHPAVVESAVLGYACPVLGERVHAFVVLRDQASEEILRSFCAKRLADYKVPERWTLRAEPLPRNANGKVLKRELRTAS